MKYYLIAGEASGDLHGANLMRALLRRDPQAQFRFWGGDRMQDVAGTPVRHIRDLAIMGFVEVLRNLHTVLGNLSFCRRDILQYRPDAIIYIDYPGFNLKIAKWAHRLGFRNIHYISPQLWAWKKGRINAMRRDLDRLCYILPFEQQFYAHNHLPQALYVGHPLLDAVAQYQCDNPCPGTPYIALLPGSRRQELDKVLPAMLRLAQRHPEYHFVIAAMSLIGPDFYRRYLGSAGNVSILYDQTYPLLAHAHAALVCSGTATLETALFDVPQVVCYSANALSVAIARRFVADRVKYISLVNLIADAPVVTELIQQDLNDERLETEFLRIAADNDARETMRRQYSRMRDILGGPGASDRTAAAILS